MVRIPARHAVGVEFDSHRDSNIFLRLPTRWLFRFLLAWRHKIRFFLYACMWSVKNFPPVAYTVRRTSCPSASAGCTSLATFGRCRALSNLKARQPVCSNLALFRLRLHPWYCSPEKTALTVPHIGSSCLLLEWNCGYFRLTPFYKDPSTGCFFRFLSFLCCLWRLRILYPRRQL